MAKVAAAPSNSLQMVGGSHKMGLTVKRKTPSELRVGFLIHKKFNEFTNFVESQFHVCLRNRESS